jgi:hypothetical protein
MLDFNAKVIPSLFVDNFLLERSCNFLDGFEIFALIKLCYHFLQTLEKKRRKWLQKEERDFYKHFIKSNFVGRRIWIMKLLKLFISAR